MPAPTQPQEPLTQSLPAGAAAAPSSSVTRLDACPPTDATPPARRIFGDYELMEEIDMTLRQAVQEDPDMSRQVQELIRQMQRLDPTRFPGNPALVEQLHMLAAGQDVLDLVGVGCGRQRQRPVALGDGRLAEDVAGRSDAGAR